MPLRSENVMSSSTAGLSVERSAFGVQRSAFRTHPRRPESAARRQHGEYRGDQEGRCILQTVGSAMSLPLILTSVLKPRPVFSTSNFTLSENVETNIGIRIW